ASPATAMRNYADNFLLLASTDAEPTKKIDALTAAVAGLPGGSFVLKTLQKGHAGGFDFLGHHLRLVSGKVRVSISPANEQDMWNRLRHMKHAYCVAICQGDYSTALKIVERLCAIVRGWLNAFRECEDLPEWESILLYEIEDQAAQL